MKVTGDLTIRMKGQGAVYIRSVCDNLLSPSNKELDLEVLSTPTFTGMIVVAQENDECVVECMIGLCVVLF